MNDRKEHVSSRREIAQVLLAGLACWLVFGALAVWLYPCCISDTMSRYAPMADAFARGDFYYAYHPRFGVLFETLAGLIASVGPRGESAVQLAAFFLLAMGAVVMFFLARRLSGSREVAWWSFALSFLATDCFLYALDGLRDPGKCPVFALLGYGLVAGSGWAFGLGLFMYITLFAYGFVVSSLLVFAWCVRALWCREWRTMVGPVTGWTAGTLAVTILTHAYTGHWVPVAEFIKYVGRWL